MCVYEVTTTETAYHNEIFIRIIPIKYSNIE